mmetsp:Transcript_30095/g.76491  ORF Transcript_30095/g.76491 Transcript_30095/m.76491 type:complete len:208 (+) Transcript_30095:126-749(+)
MPLWSRAPPTGPPRARIQDEPLALCTWTERGMHCYSLSVFEHSSAGSKADCALALISHPLAGCEHSSTESMVDCVGRRRLILHSLVVSKLSLALVPMLPDKPHSSSVLQLSSMAGSIVGCVLSHGLCSPSSSTGSNSLRQADLGSSPTKLARLAMLSNSLSVLSVSELGTSDMRRLSRLPNSIDREAAVCTDVTVLWFDCILVARVP